MASSARADPREGPVLARRRQRPLARAEGRRRRVPHPRVQRGPDLPVADPARPLDGQLRVRHLRLCLDLGADDRRPRRPGACHGRAALHSRIHPAQGAIDLLRGYLSRSRWIAVGCAALVAAAGVLLVQSAQAIHGGLSRAAALGRAGDAAVLRDPADPGRHRPLLQLDPRRAAAALRGPAPGDAGAGLRRLAPELPGQRRDRGDGGRHRADGDRGRADAGAQPQALAGGGRGTEGL